MRDRVRVRRSARIGAASLLVVLLFLVPGSLAGTTHVGGSGFAELPRLSTPTHSAVTSAPVAGPELRRTAPADPWAARTQALGAGGLSLSLTEQTVDLLNGSLLPGNVGIDGGHGPSTPAVYDPGLGRLYIDTIYSQTIAVVDGATDVDLANVPVNFSAGGIAIDPVDHSVYVTNGTGSSVAVINATSLTVVATIAVGAYPQEIVWDPTAQAMVVANLRSNSTSWINCTTRSVTATIGVGGSPISVLFDTVSHDLLVGNSNTANVSVINSTTRNVTTTVSVGSNPHVAFQNPLNGAVFVANYGSGNTTILNGSSYAKMGTVSTAPADDQVAFDPGTQRIFVLAGSSVLSLNASNDSQVNSTAVTGWSRGLAVDPVTNEVFVAGGVNNSAAILNGSTDAPIVTVPSAYTPTFAQFDPLTGEVYISEEGGANISALNGTTHAVGHDISTGTQAFWSAANPSNATAYVGGVCPGASVGSLNTTTGQIGGCPTVSIGGQEGTFDPVDHRLFISDGYSRVYALNLTSGVYSVFANLGTSPYVPYPQGLAWSPVNDSLFVVNEFWDNVTVLNASSGAYITSVPVGYSPWGAIYDPFDGSVWVADDGGSYVSRINVSSDTVATSIAVGGAPENLALDAATQQVYVVLSQSPGKVVVVGAANDTVAATLTVGSYSQGVAIDSADQLVFVTNTGSSNVSVIDALGLQVVTSVATVALPTGISYDSASRTVTVSAADIPALNLLRPTLSAGPDLTEFTASPALINLGNSTRLTATVARGNGSLSYVFSGLPSGCSSVNASSFNCTPTAAGNFTVRVNVTDQTGHSVTGTTGLSVIDHLSIVSLTAQPSTLDLGMAANLTATILGAAPPFTYEWSGLPMGCASQNTSTISCTANQTGTFDVQLRVLDAAGLARSSGVTLTVDAAPRVGSLVANLTELDLGEIVQFVATDAGGTGPLSVDFTSVPPGCTAPASPLLTFLCRPSLAGTFPVAVTVTDAVGTSANRSIQITVQPDPKVTSAPITPSPAYTGAQFQIAPVVSGGIVPYVFSYSGLPTLCPSANLPILTCTPTSPGTFDVTISVSDAHGFRATFNATEVVATAPAAPQVTAFRANPGTIQLGNGSALTATVSGGTPPLQYSFSGLPPGCQTTNALSLGCTPTATGSYTIVFHALDAAGRWANQSTSLIVTAPPLNSPPGTTSVSGSNSSAYLWVALAAAVVVAALVGIVLLRRRRAGPTDEASSSSEVEPSPDEAETAPPEPESPPDPDVAP